jgi:hypothetical protein
MVAEMDLDGAEGGKMDCGEAGIVPIMITFGTVVHSHCGRKV